MLRFLKRFFIVFSLLILVLAGGVFWLVKQPIELSTETTDLVVAPGSGIKVVAKQLHALGVKAPPLVIEWYARGLKLDQGLKAGEFELTRTDTIDTILQKIQRGEFTQRTITFIEGWTVTDIRQELAKNADVKQTIQSLSNAQIAERLGIQGPYIEGMFFPDTYYFARGSRDIDILKRAYEMQQQVVNDAWEKRSPNSQLASPYEALIMASIVEKETGQHTDRERISGVFNNRLKIGMPLQTDPTVIYGMMVANRYNGNIRRRDLQDETNPWNTYQIERLPPSPIAAPGRASIYAAVQPEVHKFLYFVAKGDGGSEFAETLSQHNRNVQKFILNK